MSIPPLLHFCWVGKSLPWAYAFAVMSAAERSFMPDIVLHHTDALEQTEVLRALAAAPRVRLSRMDPDACLARTGQALGEGDRFAALYRRLPDPAMRTDLLRAAILYAQGGIYLDLDTVTVAPLTPLLDAPAFVGCEHIVWPPAARASRSPTRLAWHVALDLVRKACRAVPHGWRVFRRVQHLYPRHVNNAVMGGEPGSDFLAAYLRAMLTAPLADPPSRYALGPHLLADVMNHAASRSVVVHPPASFYPLPPEISEHWFALTHGPRLKDVLAPETRVVHWYASVRTRELIGRMTPRHVVEHRHHQLYSALVYANAGVEGLLS